MAIPILTTGPMPEPARLPLRRWPDVVRGRVRWINTLGWCDQGLVDITVGSVVEPTEEQMRFVREARPALENLFQARQVLQVGQFNYVALLPEEAEAIGACLHQLGLPFSYSACPTWIPLGFNRDSGEVVTALRQP